LSGPPAVFDCGGIPEPSLGVLQNDVGDYVAGVATAIRDLFEELEKVL
jgi:hypothetical protein